MMQDMLKRGKSQAAATCRPKQAPPIAHMECLQHCQVPTKRHHAHGLADDRTSATPVDHEQHMAPSLRHSHHPSVNSVHRANGAMHRSRCSSEPPVRRAKARRRMHAIGGAHGERRLTERAYEYWPCASRLGASPASKLDTTATQHCGSNMPSASGGCPSDATQGVV